MEHLFIKLIEEKKDLIKRSEKRIKELENGEYFALTFLMAEQVYLNSLKAQLNELEDLFFQSWIDDTQNFLDEWRKAQ